MINKEKFIKNFKELYSWEEKYLYLIELGSKLKKMPEIFYQNKDKHRIWGCQSKVWIVIDFTADKQIKFYGDSDSAIVKGLIFLVFLLYKNIKLSQLYTFDIHSYIKKLSLGENLSYSRSQGLFSIINYLRNKFKKYKNIL